MRSITRFLDPVFVLQVLLLLQVPQISCWNTEGASGARDFVGTGLGFPPQLSSSPSETVFGPYSSSNTKVLLGNKIMLISYEAPSTDGKNLTGGVKTFWLADGTSATPTDQLFNNNLPFAVGSALSPADTAWAVLSVFSRQTFDCSTLEQVSPTSNQTQKELCFDPASSLNSNSTIKAEYLTDTSAVFEITGGNVSRVVMTSSSSQLAGNWRWPVRIALEANQVTYYTNPSDKTQTFLTNLEYNLDRLVFKCYLVRQNDNQFSQSQFNISWTLSSPITFGSMYHVSAKLYLIWYNMTIVAVDQSGTAQWNITVNSASPIKMLAGSSLTADGLFNFYVSSNDWSARMNFSVSAPARQVWRRLWDYPISPIAIGSRNRNGETREQIYLVKLSNDLTTANPNVLMTLTSSGNELTSVPTRCNTGPQVRDNAVACVWNNKGMSSVLLYKARPGVRPVASTTPSDAGIVLITFSTLLLCGAIGFVVWMYVRDL